MSKSTRAAKDAPVSAHYLSGTHWDREWYRPMQEFRLLLVEVVDQLLDIMETNPEFKYFHLDGQTCVLEDYLEIRPENRARLAKLIEAGRILIGPWFTMPDLFCPGDEALIRNFLMGRRVAREWNVEPMPIAYTCDMFGHPSQMPQIYRGFEMPHCVIGRGTNEETTPAFVWWESPDGSRVFCYKLQDDLGYGAFVTSRLLLEKEGADQDPNAEATAAESIRKYVKHEIARSNRNVISLIDAIDHAAPAADSGRFLRLLHDGNPTVRGRHSTLPAFFADAEKAAGRMPVLRGELREPSMSRHGYLWLIPNCVSSRVRLKQANDACQVLLERWAEPLFAFARVEGSRMTERFLQVAWKQVLLNHAHDSICGCSIDQVHRDMMGRFDQAHVLARQIRNKAFGHLTAACADLAKAEHEFTVTLANPVPVKRREVVEFDIHIPADFPTRFQEGFRSQTLKSFTLEDAGGNPIPYQRLEVTPCANERTQFAVAGWEAQMTAEHPVYRVAAEVDLPALGFTSLVVKPCPTAVWRLGSLRTGPASAENEHLGIQIAANGTLTLKDKQTGETYTDLLTFEDRSETGDGWFHGESVSDEIALSTAAAAQVSVVHDGPDLVTFRVAVDLSLPARYDWHAESRSDERITQTIVSRITLKRGARVVEVDTLLTNRAEDHRLRVLFPSDVRGARTWLAHHPFDFVERPIALDAKSERWQERDLAEKPFLSVQSVGAGRRGLAFLSAGGLHEGGLVDDARRTMQVTLLRSYRRTVGTPGERDGLELADLRYRFALMPFAGTLPRAEVLLEQQKLQAGILTRQTGPLASGYPRMKGTAAPVQGFVEQIDRRLVLSAIKPAENGDGLVLRLWNPEGRALSETLRFWRPVSKAQRLLLNEDRQTGKAGVAAKGRTVTVTAGPHEIVTVGLTLG